MNFNDICRRKTLIKLGLCRLAYLLIRSADKDLKAQILTTRGLRLFPPKALTLLSLLTIRDLIKREAR